MSAYSFCSHCLGLFHSRAYFPAAGITMGESSEVCIFCGSSSRTESDPYILKNYILQTLHARMLASPDVKAIGEILAKLQVEEITLEEAEIKIDEFSPGLGKTICSVIRKKGFQTITVFGIIFGAYISYQMLEESREANELSRESLELQIEQAAQASDTISEHKPNKPSVSKPRPHSPVKKNRQMRRAEKAEKRRKK